MLAACNGLVSVDGELTGETMEVVGLEASGWSLVRPDVFQELKGRKRRLNVSQRFPFASSLARMSVACELSVGGERRSLVLSKGAPETMRGLLVQVPEGYEELYKR